MRINFLSLSKFLMVFLLFLSVCKVDAKKKFNIKNLFRGPKKRGGNQNPPPPPPAPAPEPAPAPAPEPEPEPERFSTIINAITRTMETRTITQTVTKETPAPTAYTMSGNCYCQI